MPRDQEILDAARRLFVARGYGSVGVDAIGAEVGIRGPSVYSHFSGKADILARLFDAAMDTMLELAGPVRDNPREDLAHLIEAHAGFALDHRELLTVYVREDSSLDPAARRRFHGRQTAYVSRWVDALAGVHPDRPRQELQAVAAAVIGQLNSVTGWSRVALKTDNLQRLLTELASRSAGL